MKKLFNLLSSIGAGMILVTSCSAPEPEGGLPIDETVFTESNGDEAQNPLENLRLSGYSSTSYSYNFNNSFSASYRTSGEPNNVQYYKQIYNNDIHATCEVNISFSYSGLTSYPVGMTIVRTENRSDNDNSIYYQENIGITDMVFENGLLMGFNYESSLSTDDTTENETKTFHEVSISYDNDRLTVFNIDGQEYVQTWNDAGDLEEINSPYYGYSRVTYSTVPNVYGQWDPELPLVGFMQSFGWFGKAPAHYPKIISTSAPVYGNYTGTNQEMAVDYYISWEGFFDKIKSSAGSNSEQFMIDLEYSRFTNY